jgi:hypothetical protein
LAAHLIAGIGVEPMVPRPRISAGGIAWMLRGCAARQCMEDGMEAINGMANAEGVPLLCKQVEGASR